MFAQELLAKGVALSELLRLCGPPSAGGGGGGEGGEAAPPAAAAEARELSMALLATWMVEPGVDRERCGEEGKRLGRSPSPAQ